MKVLLKFWPLMIFALLHASWKYVVPEISALFLHILKWPTLQPSHNSMISPMNHLLSSSWYQKHFPVGFVICLATFSVTPPLDTSLHPLENVASAVLAHWRHWHILPKGLEPLLRVPRDKRMMDHLTVMDSSQLSTSLSPCPEQALSSSVVIGWGADAMMSSILNSDFISVRLMVQGMSLENKVA